MEEVFPVLAGIALALATCSVRSKRLRAIWVVFLGLVLGATASWVSGELAVSWIYVVIDAAQVVGAAVMTVALVEAWRRRSRWMAR
jgi:hypothetical protein